MKKVVYTVLAVFLLVTSCVTKKKYLEVVESRDYLKNSLGTCEKQVDANKARLLTCENDLGHSENKVHSLEQQMDYFMATNTNLLDRLADLSVVSTSGAESIKKSLEALNEQNKYIKDLTTSMRKKDSLNLVMVVNLKRSLSDVNDEDVTIEVKKGVVYISLSDKMLFKTGSAKVLPRAEEVLGKIAKVVKDYKTFDILVEGHTDNVPIRTECMEDNWDLSVKRATSVVRTLQEKYAVNPERMTAGGRGEYIPKTSNDSDKGKSLNRRTEIIILPKLDEFFQLFEPPVSENR